MTAKLTEVATERFVDNVTSITPGALQGGIHAVARHPDRDEVVIGRSPSADLVLSDYAVSRRHALPVAANVPTVWAPVNVPFGPYS